MILKAASNAYGNNAGEDPTVCECVGQHLTVGEQFSYRLLLLYFVVYADGLGTGIRFLRLSMMTYQILCICDFFLFWQVGFRSKCLS